MAWGRLVASALTPGQCGDAPVAPDLVRALPPSETLAADRAYDSDALRAMLIARGTTPVILNGPRAPSGCTPSIRRLQAPQPHRARLRRLKDFRRIATRYDKLVATYAAAVCLAAIVTWWI